MGQPARYDAIVIGSGHNGLITAGYLARPVRRVLVLERRDIIGGAAVTEDTFPGYRLSTCSYVCNLLAPGSRRRSRAQEIRLPRAAVRADVFRSLP